MLQEKDENEEKAKEALKQQAKTELEDWYKQHSEQVNYQKISLKYIKSSQISNIIFLS